MYSTYNEGKSVVAEIFIRTLKARFLNIQQLFQKNVYFDVLDHIADKYNNTVHITIKMKPIDATRDSYVEYNEYFNKKGRKFKVSGHVRTSKYKTIFAKGYTPNWSDEVFVIKITNTVPWTYVISDLNSEEIAGSFYEKELQKTNQKEFRIEKVLKRKSDKLCVEWKIYDHCFNSWINKKDLV